VFLVHRSGATGQTVTVEYETRDGSALASDGDYQATSGTLTFGPNDTVLSVTVAVAGNTTVESDETFFLTLFGASANAQVTQPSGMGTVVNDDVSADWALAAAQRRNDPDRATLVPIGQATVALNTGGLRLSHPLDFDRNPGTGVGRDPALVYSS